MLLQPHAHTQSIHTSNIIIRNQTTSFDTNTIHSHPTCAKDALDTYLSPDPCVVLLNSNALTEQLDEAAVAVGFVVLFFKGAFVELFQAEGADKMLRVELLGHGRDTAACDGLLTAGAEGAAALVVVHFTVGLAIVLKETSIHKWGKALL